MSLALALAQAAAIAALEAEHYVVDYLPTPEGARLEVGGMDFLSDGRLVVSTRRGQVWKIENPLAADPKAAKFTLFAEGLHEGLGLEVVNDEIYVLQRGELSKLFDDDGDGVCDRIDTFAQGWGYSGHYHEFAFGLPRDNAGNFYASFNVSFDDQKWWHGRSTVPDRGWILRIKPDGSLERVASGARSPCGLGRNSAGDIFYTDNQGDWMPACPIFHVTDGAFFGHPAGLNWTPEYIDAGRTASDTLAPEHPRVNAAIWLPYDWSRSTGNLVSNETGGKFGPFEGQLFVAEMTNGYVLRADLEKVQGQYQGWVVPFRHKVGSNVRLRFAKDGTLFCGFTDRGWGGQPPGDGIGRIRMGAQTPFEIAKVRLAQQGFEISFTKPLAAEPAALPKARVSQYDYNYWWEYGSPPTNVTERTVLSVARNADASKLFVHVAGLAPGMVARVKLDGLVAADGSPLLHDEFAYTVNQLPEGPPTKELVAKEVVQPQARERSDEGALYLMRGETLAAWNAEGWSVGEIKLDPNDRKKLVAAPDAKPNDWSGPAVSNVGAEAPGELVSKLEFGDFDFSFDFLLPEGGNSGLYLMGRYEIQLRDSGGKPVLEPGDCGGIYAASDANVWPGRAPTFDIFRGPGRWHGMTGSFVAPRFDASGKKIENARLRRVMVNDTLLHEEIEIPAPTAGGWEGEVRFGPLRIQGDHGHVAIRGFRVKSREVAPALDGWTALFDGASLDGWRMSDNGQWKVENGEIVGSGAASHLFSPRGDYTNFELRAKVRINGKGNSGLYFRTAFGPSWPAGYEAQINSSHSDPVKTGSLYHLALLKTAFVPDDAWFDYHVTCRDEAEGVRIQIRVNNVLVTDHLDRERKHKSGHFAFQQHHEGSVVRFREIFVRELP
jgi:glucose/arabinose dehydrogenase